MGVDVASIREHRRRHRRAASVARATRARAVLIGLVGRGISSSRSPAHARARRRAARPPLHLRPHRFRPLRPRRRRARRRRSRPRASSALPASTSPIPSSRRSSRISTDLAPDAAAIGAVNTVVFDGGRRIGHNTDCWGFAESFRAGPRAAHRSTRVVQFGAGGGGAAVAHALLELGAAQPRHLRSRHQPRDRLADRLTERFGRTVVVVSDPLAAIRRAAGRGQRHAGGHGEISRRRLRHRRRSSRATGSPTSSISPPRPALLQARARARLPHARRHWHGDLPGHQGLRALHRPHARPGRDGPAFRGGRLRRSAARTRPKRAHANNGVRDNGRNCE